MFSLKELFEHRIPIRSPQTKEERAEDFVKNLCLCYKEFVS